MQIAPLPRKLPMVALVLALAALLAAWLIFAPPGVLGKADALGYAVCHRIAERSFTIAGRPMPLCARCTGIYLGALAGLIFQLRSGRAAGLPPARVLAVFGLALAAFAFDGINSFLHLLPGFEGPYEPSNTLRLLTGTGLGLGIAAVLYPLFNETIFHSIQNRAVFPTLRSLVPLLGLGVGLDLLVMLDFIPLRFVLGLLSAAAVPLILGLSFGLLWVLLVRREATYMRWQQAAVPLLAGLVSAASMIGLIDWARFALTGVWGGLPL